MKKECNVVINGIINQLIADESFMKAHLGDENASLESDTLELKIILTVEDNAGKKFKIGNYRSAIEIKE